MSQPFQIATAAIHLLHKIEIGETNQPSCSGVKLSWQPLFLRVRAFAKNLRILLDFKYTVCIEELQNITVHPYLDKHVAQLAAL